MRTRTAQCGSSDYIPSGLLDRPREIILGTNPTSKDVVDMRRRCPNRRGKSRLGHSSGSKEGSEIAHQNQMYDFVSVMQGDFLDTNANNVTRLHTEGMSRYLYRDNFDRRYTDLLEKAGMTSQEVAEAITEEAKQSKRGIVAEVVVPMVDAYRQNGQIGLDVQCKMMVSRLKL